jgi:hypothetical protein
MYYEGNYRYNSKENENKRRGITMNHLKKMVEKDSRLKVKSDQLDKIF